MPTILLATADDVHRRLVRLLFERLGHGEPVAVADGRAAVARLLESRCDVALIDADLPALGAAAVAMAIEHERPANRPHFIAMLAPEAGHIDVRGMDQRLMRPLQRSALAAALDRAGAAPARAAPPADFDPAAYAELVRVFKLAGAAEMVAALVTDAPEQQRRCAAAVADGDAGALRRVAHALHGTSLQLRARGLADLCADVERKLAAGEQPRAAALAADMIERHLALVRALAQAAGDAGRTAGRS